MRFQISFAEVSDNLERIYFTLVLQIDSAVLSFTSLKFEVHELVV